MQRLEDWHIVAVLTALLLIMAATIVSEVGVTEAGLRMLVRASARSSAVLFLTAFAAPGVASLHMGAASAWLGRIRRPILLSFGVSHPLHLVVLVCWASLFPRSFLSDFRVVAVLVGAMLYVFIAFTCLRLILRPLSVSRWVVVVEGVGASLLWLAFALAYVLRARSSGLYGVLALLALASLGLRLAPRFVYGKQAPDVV
jgi:hypothetical protein